MTRNEMKVTKTIKAKIVTSGYSDRFLIYDAKYELTFDNNSYDVKVNFDNEDEMIKFLISNGMEFDDAWNVAVVNAETTVYMSGKFSRRVSGSTVLTNEQIRSIDSYLKLNHGRGYTADAVKDFERQLENYPIEADLMNLVKWQLVECDRKNIETWGHKNGQHGK